MAPLVKSGPLVLTPAPDDARSRLLRLSASGERLLQAAYPRWKAVQRKLTRALRKLTRALDEHGVVDLRAARAVGHIGRRALKRPSLLAIRADRERLRNFRSRFRDLNSRPAVYESVPRLNNFGSLGLILLVLDQLRTG